MSNKKKQTSGTATPPQEEQSAKQASALNWRGWVIRGVILSVLMFGFVSWRLQPMVGNMAFVWAGLFAAAILGWLGISYYLLNR